MQPTPALLKSLATSLTAAALLSSCVSYTVSGTGTGAAIGAGLGALIDDDHSARGALIGAGIGAALGALVGNAADRDAQRRSRQLHPDYYGGNAAHALPLRNSESNFPWGRPSRPGAAISPYPPHREINVQGYRRGELVVDPTTEGVFRVP